MPDKDIFNKKFVPGWRGVAKKIVHGIDSKYVSNLIFAALKKTLRNPEIKMGLTKAIDLLLDNNSKIHFFNNLNNYLNDFINRTNRELFQNACWRTHLLINEFNQEKYLNQENVVNILLNKICYEFADHNLFSKLSLIKHKNSNFDTEEYRKEFVVYLEKKTNDIKKLFDIKIVNPKTQKKFGISKFNKKSTSEMLNTPINLI